MTYLFLCGGSYVFGQEIVELNIMRELVSRGERVHCLVNGWNDGDFIRRLDEAEIPYTVAFTGKITLKVRRLGWTLDTLRHLPGARGVVRRLLTQLNPDAIVACNRDTVVLLKRLLAAYCVAFHIQEVPEVTPRSRAWTFLLARSVRGFIATSEFVKVRFVELGVGEQMICVAQAGIDLPASSHTADLWTAPIRPERPTPVVGICGQVAPWKGHEDLAHAMALLHQQGCDFRLLIFGRGDPIFETRLRELIQDYGYSHRVEWRGFEADRDVMYASCDVVAVPSRFDDPFPTTVLEAGAYGLPVVATVRGGIPEQVEDGVTGFLVREAMPSELAAKIRLLLESKELRERLGNGGRARVNGSFQSQHMVDRFVQSMQAIRSTFPTKKVVA